MPGRSSSSRVVSVGEVSQTRNRCTGEDGLTFSLFSGNPLFFRPALALPCS